MGRLTLNLLLSFAQFEREVIGGRIRDKIRGRVADPITGGAVLEYGPTEISPPFR
jgi:DNA invertase Pin-like site-specific DNA recombinase